MSGVISSNKAFALNKHTKEPLDSIIISKGTVIINLSLNWDISFNQRIFFNVQRKLRDKYTGEIEHGVNVSFNTLRVHEMNTYQYIFIDR